jgi:hypothetical protein
MMTMRREIFTKEFLVSIGCDDNDNEIDEMIHALNLLTIRWGPDARSKMQRFLNIVKSKTDELSVVLTAGVGSLEKVAGPSTIKDKDTDMEIVKLQAKEIERLDACLRDIQPRFQAIQSELTVLKSKFDHLKRIEPEVIKEKLRLMGMSFSKKCRELDSNSDMTARHFAWFNEQVTTHSVNKSEMDRIVHSKDKEIADLKSRMVTNALQVDFSH